MPSIMYTLTGDNKDLDESIEATIKELERMRSQTRKTDDALDDLGDQGKKAGDKLKGAASDAGKFKAGAESAKQAATALGGKVGEMGGRVEAAGRSVAALAEALGPVGVAAAAAAVSIGAAVVGVGALAAGIYKTIAAAVEFRDDVEALEESASWFNGLDDNERAALDRMANSFAAIRDLAKALVVIIGADLAQTFGGVIPAAVTWMEDLVVAFEDLGRESSIATQLIYEGLTGILAPFTAAINATALMIEGQLRLVEILGGEVNPALRDFVDRAKDIDLAAEATDLLRSGWEGLNRTWAEASKTGALIAEQLQDIKDRGDAAAESTKALEEAWVEFDFSAEEDAAEKIIELEKYRVEAAQERHDAIVAMTEEQLDLELASASQVSAAWLDATDDIIGAANKILQTRLDNQATETREQRKEARKQFNTLKGLAIIQAIVQAAAAIVRQYADLPLYAAIPASIAVGVTTGAEIATIAAAQPEFPVGTSQTPDHTVNAALQPGEAVLTRQAVASIGGPAAAAALNDARATGGRGRMGQALQVLFRGEVLDTMMAEVLAAPGSTGSLLGGSGYGLKAYTT